MKNQRILISVVCAVISIFIVITVGVTGCSEEEQTVQDKPVPVQEEPSEAYDGDNELNNVTVYAYCPCAICNTKKWKGMVSTGKKMKDYISEGKNICAADPNVIPIGTSIIYNGVNYLVADTGGQIKGNTINILLKSHKEVYDFGIKRNQTITIEERD